MHTTIHHHHADAIARLTGDALDQIAPLGPDCIDGSQDGLRRFLAEMAQLTGETGDVLALELDGMLTAAMAAPQGGLVLTTRLPRGGARVTRGVTLPGHELAWHAEQGCEVLARHVPLSALQAEADVLDAMMDQAALARALVDAR